MKPILFLLLLFLVSCSEVGTRGVPDRVCIDGAKYLVSAGPEGVYTPKYNASGEIETCSQ